ncbi:Bystin-domain-containing protein [Radiomyces spectabilis]|uniref:Bystin-domain-containing protein n=1 Tax=Radiomyces spectabilis TaxID=64574 RepID=UPI002220717D|nr:Bystin-domain-containing protein [Radiomyces spectabilis]KAI8371507.1 Bystin-domain-containing protein [Radiomyces spectabilis]
MGKEALKMKTSRTMSKIHAWPLGGDKSIHIFGRQNTDDSDDEKMYTDPRIAQTIMDIAAEQKEHQNRHRDDEEESIQKLKIGLAGNDDHMVEDYDLDIDEDPWIIRQFIPENPTPLPTLADELAVYGTQGQILSHYQSGKLPKAFKIIPSLTNWEEILQLTNPKGWSPSATYEITRLFMSHFRAVQSQRFFGLVLLDRFRENVAYDDQLHPHMYSALKKALLRPIIFFKGFLFPLCESGNCMLHEAAILANLLSQIQIPAIHSSAAILRLADMIYSPPNSLFIRVLLEKQYSLPHRVVDALVLHYLRLADHPYTMPRLWYQSLLVFVKGYHGDMIPEQKDGLLSVCDKKPHAMFTPRIRQQLFSTYTPEAGPCSPLPHQQP